MSDPGRLHSNRKIQTKFHPLHFNSALACLIDTVCEMLLMKVFYVHVASNARVLTASYTKTIRAKVGPMLLGHELHTRSFQRRQF